MELLKEGTMILSLGMGFVFIFLVIMVFSMHFMSFVIKKINEIFPEEIKEEKTSCKKKSAPDNEIALALAIAFAEKKEDI